MGYHILTTNDSSDDDFLLDRFLGSATTLDLYWESIGRKLNLPLIASITEKADSEEGGFVLSGTSLILFKEEMAIFEKYWLNECPEDHLPSGFLQNLRLIMDGINNAIDNNLTLMIC